MKFNLGALATFILLFNGCAHTPKYKIGECVSMSIWEIDDHNEWTSMGYHLGSFRVIDYLKTKKNYYVVQTYEFPRKAKSSNFGFRKYIIPIKDLDNFHYAHKVWTLTEGECKK